MSRPLVFVLMLAISGSAFGWQLPARHALRLSAAALRGPPALGDFEVGLVGRARESGSETIRSLGVRWVFGRTSHGATAITQVQGGPVATWTREAAKAPAVTDPTVGEKLVLPRLFADADPALLCQSLGVDLERSHLALQGEVVAEVHGALSGDRTAPQVWLDHETHRPIRVVFRVAGGPWVRVDLVDWDAGPDGIAFPRRVTVYENDRWVRIFEAQPARRLGP